MPGPTRRKKYHQGITSERKKYRTKRRTRDIDQIVDDLSCPKTRLQLQNQPVDLDLPGGGQHYCIPCARHFIAKQAFEEHCRGKAHKKRLKEVEEVPYSVEESEKAAGLGSYIAPVAKKPRLEHMDAEIVD